MKLDVTQKIMRLDDPTKAIFTQAPVKDDGSKNPDAKPLTLRIALVEALMGLYKDEENLEGRKKLRRWWLAKRIQKDDEVEVSVKENALLQSLVHKRWGVSVYGPVVEMLELAAGTNSSSADDDDDEE